MMELVNKAAELYAEKFSSAEDDLLQAINLHTSQTHPHAHMLSGHVQGSFLSLLSRLLKPKRILEIGTFTGYSALCLAKGLQPGGFVHTIELREEDATVARAYFEQSPIKTILNCMWAMPIKSSPHCMNYGIWFLLMQIKQGILIITN
jgi:caffeoyl-CoA O-methyltransferase